MTTWRTTAVDRPEAQALLAEYFASRAETFPASMGEYRPVYPTPEQFVAPRGVFLIEEQDGMDVGCGGIRQLTPTRYEVKHLWVQPQARGTGLGRRLLEELERRARALGATQLVLDTNASQAAAAALYRSAGYVEVPAYNDNANATHWFSKNLVEGPG
jgi:GNAT superfamily N-acetyltransferase